MSKYLESSYKSIYHTANMVHSSSNITDDYHLGIFLPGSYGFMHYVSHKCIQMKFSSLRELAHY